MIVEGSGPLCPCEKFETSVPEKVPNSYKKVVLRVD